MHSPPSDGHPALALSSLEVDQYTLQSKRWPEVFALGEVANLPTSKTGAAIRKQAPVVVGNPLAGPPTAHYDGYTSCPVAAAHNRMLLAEFDYQLTCPAPQAGVRRAARRQSRQC